MKIKNFSLLLILILGGCVTAPVPKVIESPVYYEVNVPQDYVRPPHPILKTPIYSTTEIDCLARNIFYEAGAEPLEGKVAVAAVTINRTKDDRYGSKTICGIVHARTLIGKGQYICQFSWTCGTKSILKKNDPRWIASKEVAENLARGDYNEYTYKYRRALNFHAIAVKPSWIRTKRSIGRVGGHIFYE